MELLPEFTDIPRSAFPEEHRRNIAIMEAWSNVNQRKIGPTGCFSLLRTVDYACTAIPEMLYPLIDRHSIQLKERLSELDHTCIQEHLTILIEVFSSRDPVEVAAEKGPLNLLKWMKASRKYWISNHCMVPAARGGQLEVLQWLKENDMLSGIEWRVSRISPRGRATSAAACGGHLKVLEWLREIEWILWPAVFEGACKGTQIRVLEWMQKYTSMRSYIFKAARYGNIKVATWLGCNSDIYKGTKVVSIAVENGHLKFVEWATRHGYQWGKQTRLDILKLAIEQAELQPSRGTKRKIDEEHV